MRALTLLGTPAPVAADAIAGWPSSLGELLATWGPGTLGGRFRVLAPDDARRAELVAFARGAGAELNALGYWARIADWRALEVFAEGQASDVLAFAGDELYWLGARGEVVLAGRNLDELVANFLRSRHVERVYGGELPATFATGADPLADVLAALRAGDDAAAERAFEHLLGSDAPQGALVRLVGALYEAASGIARERRVEWLATCGQLLRRRLAKAEYGELGLDAALAALRAGREVDDELRAKLVRDASAPSWDRAPREHDGSPVTVDQLVHPWQQAADPAFDLDAVRASVDAIPASARRTALVALDDLYDGWGLVMAVDGTNHDPSADERVQRFATARVRLEGLPRECAPLFVLALRGPLQNVAIERLAATAVEPLMAAVFSILRRGGAGADNLGWALSYVRLPAEAIAALLANLDVLGGPVMQALHNQDHDDRVFALLRSRAAQYPEHFANACERRKDRALIPELWQIARRGSAYDYTVIRVLAELGDDEAAKIQHRLDLTSEL